MQGLLKSKTLFLLCAMTSLFSCSSSPARKIIQVFTPETLQVKLSNEKVKQGDIFIVTVSSVTDKDSIKVMYQENEIPVYPNGENTVSAMVGVSDLAAIGPSVVTVKNCHDKCVEKQTTIQIIAGNFPSEQLTVPPRTVKPKAKDQRRIAREMKVLKKVYSSSISEKLWSKPCVLPIHSEITSAFGMRRLYNGEFQKSHNGTDFRAATGTPIAAPLDGKVVIARDLFFTGNTIILDHGYGLFTIYGHMSKLKVKEGTQIKKEKIMGLSGATGRVSGPHLHWGVNLHGTKVDPLALVQLLNE